MLAVDAAAVLSPIQVIVGINLDGNDLKEIAQRVEKPFSTR